MISFYVPVFRIDTLATPRKTDVWSGAAAYSSLAHFRSSACILLELFGLCQPYSECSHLPRSPSFPFVGPKRGNLQQILNMLLVQQEPPSLPEGMEPAVRTVIAQSLRHEAHLCEKCLSEMPIGMPRNASTCMEMHRNAMPLRVSEATLRPQIGEVLLQLQAAGSQKASHFQWVP